MVINHLLSGMQIQVGWSLCGDGPIDRQHEIAISEAVEWAELLQKLIASMAWVLRCIPFATVSLQLMCRTLTQPIKCYNLISFPLIWTLWISLGHTSGTAQGGGGSFKNRKPIGEIGCCESGMAERSHWWTERCLRSPLFLSLSLAIYLPTNLSSMYLSIYRSISLSFI